MPRLSLDTLAAYQNFFHNGLVLFCFVLFSEQFHVMLQIKDCSIFSEKGKVGRIIFVQWVDSKTQKKGKETRSQWLCMKLWMLSGDNVAPYKEVTSLHHTPFHTEMAVASHHGKDWAVFLPSNAPLADGDHGAVKIETGGERLVTESLKATRS